MINGKIVKPREHVNVACISKDDNQGPLEWIEYWYRSLGHVSKEKVKNG